MSANRLPLAVQKKAATLCSRRGKASTLGRTVPGQSIVGKESDGALSDTFSDLLTWKHDSACRRKDLQSHLENHFLVSADPVVVPLLSIHPAVPNSTPRWAPDSLLATAVPPLTGCCGWELEIPCFHGSCFISCSYLLLASSTSRSRRHAATGISSPPAFSACRVKSPESSASADLSAQ